MYSPQVTKTQIQAVEKVTGQVLEPSSAEQIEIYTKHFNELRNGSELTRALTKEETAWIEKERAICCLDFRYWCENYAHILDTANRKTKFLPNIPQNIILDICGEMEEAGVAIMLMQLKARQEGMCLCPGTRVLTSNLSWVSLDDMNVGDKIIALDEFPLKARASRHFKTATVEAKQDVFAPAFLVTFENGQTLTATAEHKFLGKRRHGCETLWRTVKDTLVGDVIRRATDIPWEAPNVEDSWFGGLLDGEGCLRQKRSAGVECCVAQVAGNVLDRARAYLIENNHTFREEIDHRKSGESSKLGNKPVHKLVLNRLNEIFMLIGKTNPCRWNEFEFWHDKDLPGKRSTWQAWEKVVSIEELEPQRMIDLQTSTKTFIAEGFVSHNSTLAELMITHRVQFHSHINAIVGSSDPDKTRKMANMMRFCWDNQPWWLVPNMTKYKAGELFEFGELGSSVSLAWGNQTTGIGRGTTPTAVHLSELADFENPKELVDASLLRAMHDDPFTLLILESTANGRENWWHDKWETCKLLYPKGMSRLRPVFLPWYIAGDLYPNKTWLKAHPVPENYEPPIEIEDHALRAQEYVEAQPTIRKYLGENWVMPNRQKWFYEANRMEYKLNNELNKWYQEMPATDLESFQHKQSSIFDAEFLTELRNACKKPKLVLGLIGPEDEIPLRLQPTSREIDTNSNFKPLTVNPSTITGKPGSSYRLVPIKWQGISTDSPIGKIFLYEFPEKFNDYGIGVDTAFGVGQDRTVVQVVRKATPYENAEQCVEFATDQAGAFEIWPFVLALSSLFSVVPSSGGLEKRQAKVCIEMAANGEATQRELLKRGWWNLHIQQKAQTRGWVPTNKTTPLFGWKTTEQSRGPMLDFLRKALVDRWLTINSPWFVDEMGNFIRNEKKERLEAAEGAKDDRLMAMGIVLDSLHRMEMYRSATPSWQARLAAEAESKTYPTFHLGWNIAGSEARDIEQELNDHMGTDESFEEYC